MRYSLELRETIELPAFCAEVSSTPKQLYSSVIAGLVCHPTILTASALTSQKHLFLPPQISLPYQIDILFTGGELWDTFLKVNFACFSLHGN